MKDVIQAVENTVTSKEQQRKAIAKHIEEYLKENNKITMCEPAPNKIVKLKDISIKKDIPTKH